MRHSMLVACYSALRRPLYFPPEILHAILADVVAQFLQDLFFSSFIDWNACQKCLASSTIPALLQVCHQYREVMFTVLHDVFAIKRGADGCLPMDAWRETEHVMRALSLSRCGTAAQYDEHVAMAQRCSSKLLQAYLEVGTMEGRSRALARSHVASVAPLNQLGINLEHAASRFPSLLADIKHETFCMSFSPFLRTAVTKSMTLYCLTISRFDIIDRLQYLERLGERIDNDILQGAAEHIESSLRIWSYRVPSYRYPGHTITILDTVYDLNPREEDVKIACLRTIPSLWSLLDNQRLSVERIYLDIAQELLKKLRLMVLSECAPLTCPALRRSRSQPALGKQSKAKRPRDQSALL
ncbi:uncharacterized protein LAESUDRAFT_132002 [Laetiporus sulphureus 93-53]|uniref:Uncharacterized protein n=1 Tax=Laetiporus sulphureus 93-53 TaxID=1314785 RepID=A0A165EHW1_9APHY|nr:uncharacterized protein LAESUDRAFT_132002 [Laetiporus sulphureus 93-53]KZT07081.1 hypothetical protein LAESUDRAFT_132002 [Laetiporus sulphureus 93-53]